MASKSKRRRKVLGASCILAALIIAGSSFAWFTSKDEVTNRLTATTNYGVSLVEDFLPPKDMTPGQEVNKDVSVVNTGAIDAFARVWLASDVNYTRLSSEDAELSVSKITEYYTNATATATATAETTNASTIGSYTEGDLTDPNGYPDYLYSQYTFTNAVTKPTNAVELNPRQTIDSNGILHANEVTTLQAGGQLVVANSVSVTPENLTTRSGDDVNDTDGVVEILYQKGANYIYYNATDDKYYTVTKNANGTYTKTTTEYTFSTDTLADWNVIGVQKDYSGVDQFKPAANGFYIFRRADGSYSGYYYASNKFYALATVENVNTQTSGSTRESTVTLKSSSATDPAVSTDTNGVVNSLNLEFVTKDADNDNSKCTITSALVATAKKDAAALDNTSGKEYTTAKYIRVIVHDDDDTTTTDNDIYMYIKLDDSWSTNWTYVPAKSSDANVDADAIGYFYYNDKLNSGETSAKLVDSVTLDKTMGKSNYLDLVYDLNVGLESVQVTRDEHNNQSADGVTDTWAAPTLTWDTTQGHSTYGDITSVSWAARP